MERDFISICYIWSIWTIILFNLFVYHQVDEYIPKWIENGVKSYVMEHDIYGWIFMVAMLLVLSWIISTIGYALKHGDFTVNRRNDEVRISQGLLEKKELVLKLHRIQGITIKESILRQPFGYCAVQVEVIQSKGMSDEKKRLHCTQSFEKIEYNSYSPIYNYHTN